MARPSSYPPELRRRAVRMVAEVLGDHPNESAALRAVAEKPGVGSAETLRNWVRRDQVDSGQRPGTTTEESAQIKAMRKGIAELKRANEVLKAAASFLAAEPSARTVRDEGLKELIKEVCDANYRVHGARKVWRELGRQGRSVARCTVERLMRELGITGAVRGRKVVTTIADQAVESAPDPVDRKFVATAPNRCWVADFTHVRTFSGVVRVAFVVDTFSRRIVGWSAAMSKEARLVLDALEMALWQRDRDGFPHQGGELIHHSDAGSQYTSFRLAEHLDAVGIAASIGSVGDADDNALMEPTIGLYKTELIKPGRPWRTLAQVELATAEWTDWYCHRRLHGEIGHVPPVEHETNYYLTATKPQVTTTT
ncbi:IS3 family transposase [Kitasatospora cineracea]|uniref:Transposase n=1 Tax=Kitasatospora cineracea TaxID=88074 RepID=A0A3N4R418_9ACTN|nr:IS3 family transposase [Kitasatospora cineracea]RPE27942.1 putative transposase [Kitasatospora cineracea]